MTNTQLKTQIDLAITNKNLAATITPTDVGNNMKDVVDYADQQDLLSMHLAGTEIVTGNKTFITQLTGANLLVNNATNGFPGMLVTNSALGIGIKVSNPAGGTAINIDNIDGLGLSIDNGTSLSGIFLDNLNAGTGITILNDIGIGMSLDCPGIGTCIDVTSGPGTGVQITGAGSGTALHIDCTGGPGLGVVVNNSNANAGNAFVYQKNSVNRFVVNDAGSVNAISFVKAVNLPNQLLKADGATTVGYKVYTAKLTQTGTLAPAETVLEDSTGISLTWSYVAPGQYRIIASAPLFTVSKTMIFTNLGSTSYTIGSEFIPQVSSTTICDFATTNGIALANDILLNASLEIRIYN